MFIKFLFFISLIFNTLVLNLRYFIEYEIYTLIIFIILAGFCFDNQKKLFSNYLSIFLIIYSIIIFPIQNHEDINKILKTRPSKLDTLCNNKFDDFKFYSKKFTNNTYKNICNKN